jgi:glycine/D-amino acid oxidase-like deaminating enzyme
MRQDSSNHVNVLIIGRDVVGCAILYELARFNATVALLEGRLDVCDATSKANSALYILALMPLLARLKRSSWPKPLPLAKADCSSETALSSHKCADDSTQCSGSGCPL